MYKIPASGSLTRLAWVASMLVCAVLVMSAPAFAQTHLRLSNAQMGRTQYVDVGQNKSMILDLPVAASEVIVSQPGVATAVMRSKQRAIIQGISNGQTNIFFLDAQGRTISVLEMTVKSAPSAVAANLQESLRRILPGSNIKVDSVDTGSGANNVVLSGTARSGDDITKATAIAAQFTGGDGNVANIITVEGSQQVMLKVTVAEVNREVVKQLGINLSGSFSTGALSTSILNTPSLGGASGVVNSNSATLGVSSGGFSLEATLRALERQGASRTLAEPTLTTISGQEAHFLAGGQYPVPSGISDGVVSFEFRQFGVELTFTPTVMSNGQVGLKVDTSVSEPTVEGGFSVGGITVPATKERQASTTVQLHSGSTLAIAGLIEEKVRAQINELPGISKLPILGALFRSRDFIRSQTELVILVTPVTGTQPAPQLLPTDGMVFASDAEQIFLGRMEKLYGVGGELRGSVQYQGSVGFVLD